MPSERSPTKLGSEVGDKDGDQKRHRRLQDPLPLNSPRDSGAQTEVFDASNTLNRKSNERGERTRHSDPTTVPRSRSFFQHDERGTASHDGRRSGRRVTSERGWWKDSKDEDQAAHRAAGSSVHEEGKSLARGGDNHVWRHDRFSEVEGASHQPTKKRRQFREEKLPVVHEPAENAASEPNKTPHDVSSAVSSERREERGRDRHPLERSDNDRPYARERSFSNRGRVEKAGFPPRDRSSGSDNGGRYRGRDNFGGRQGYRSTDTGGRVDKWKHDLFDEANRSPTAKHEEDPVAKVEALLAS